MTDFHFTAADYLEIRRRGVALHSKIFKKLIQEDVKTCAKHLGIWRSKAVALESDEEVDLFADYCVYGYRPHGFNMAEKFLRLFHQQADDFELDLLRHTRDAHYAIYQIEETNGVDRLKVVDVFSKAVYPLVDYQLAKTAYQGVMLAGYLIDFGDFQIQTGGSVRVTREIFLVNEVARVIDQIDDDQLVDFLNNPANGSKLARAILSATFRLRQTGNFNIINFNRQEPSA